jgi:excisionase family DNA binding protein
MNDLPFGRLLPVSVVVARLGMSKSFVYELISAGHLTYVKMGKSYRIPEKSLEAYMKKTVVWSFEEFDSDP